MSNFSALKTAVDAKFQLMSTNVLFFTSASKDELWDTYLSSFEEGTNPLYLERTEHDCNCCKQFIRTMGNVVTIQDGKLVSIWDVKVEAPYQVVVDALSKLVKQHEISSIFLHDQKSVGTDHNFGTAQDGSPIRWDAIQYALKTHHTTRKSYNR
jgi:hypothetical protein